MSLYRRRSFVDMRIINQRMDRTDLRFQRAARAQAARAALLPTDVVPTDWQVIRDEPVTTKLRLDARETIEVSRQLTRGRTLPEALRSIQAGRAFLASFPVAAAPAAPVVAVALVPVLVPAGPVVDVQLVPIVDAHPFGDVVSGEAVRATYGYPTAGYTPRARWGRRQDGRSVRIDGTAHRP